MPRRKSTPRRSSSSGLRSRSASPSPRAPSRGASPEPPAPRARAAKEEQHEADEFGGPLGAVGVMVGLPLVVGYLVVAVEQYQGQLWVPASVDDFLEQFPRPTARAAAFYAIWMGVQVVLAQTAPGRWHKGQPLADGSRLDYHLNGWASMLVTVAGAVALTRGGLVPARLLADMAGELFAVANAFAIAASFALYAAHALGLFGLHFERCTGNVVYDLFHGASINPRVGGLDLKFFCEGRPGLTLWMLLAWSCAARQLDESGAVSLPMALAVAGHTWYVVDYFYGEAAILTTMDIMHDKLGYMLVWGDLVWVPFTFALQEQVLLSHAGAGWPLLAGAVLLQVVGFYIFRSSNAQKHDFRTDPEGAGARVWGRAPEYLQTARGTKLLTSGWWGLSRHPNYLGDWLQGLAWCLPVGCASPVGYFYAVYFLVLLVHRERRDNANCAAKYGKDWERYCELVPKRIVPGVY